MDEPRERRGPDHRSGARIIAMGAGPGMGGTDVRSAMVGPLQVFQRTEAACLVIGQSRRRIFWMAPAMAFDAPRPIKHPALAERQGVAVANANWFRAMAWRALRDGSPNGALRATHARAAARIVLRHARRDALVYRMASEALGPAPEARRVPGDILLREGER